MLPLLRSIFGIPEESTDPGHEKALKAAIETAVDGTRFLISGADPATDPVTVRVTKGQVRVSQAGGETFVLQRGDAITMGQDGKTTGLQTGSLGPGTAPAVFGSTWQIGRPRLTLGLLGGGTYAGQDFAPSARVTAGLALPGNLRLELDVGAQPGASSTRLPAGLGLRWGPGNLTVGGQLYSAWENQTLDCGGSRKSLHIGGAGSIRAELPLGRNISLLGDLRAGYADALLAEAAVGLGVGL